MAIAKDSVVTPERFASGFTYQEYVNQIENNKAKFDANYAGTKVSDENARVLRELVALPNGPAKMLVIGEDWCPDVYRGMPVLARIAEAAGMEMRVFRRDDHLDIMMEFLNRGEYQTVPTAVFYTRDHKYLGHWIERPAKANQEMHLYNALREGKTREEAAPDLDRFQQGDVWAGWRDATVDEITEMLDALCNR